jgi:hypothetical protein
MPTPARPDRDPGPRPQWSEVTWPQDWGRPGDLAGAQAHVARPVAAGLLSEDAAEEIAEFRLRIPAWTRYLRALRDWADRAGVDLLGEDMAHRQARRARFERGAEDE